MNVMPFRPLRAVPPESAIAALNNRRAAVEVAVRSYADLRCVAISRREDAIDEALRKLDSGSSAATAIEAGCTAIRRGN